MKKMTFAEVGEFMSKKDYSLPENQISEEEFKKFSKDTTAQDSGITKVLPLATNPQKGKVK